jgi:hypothetical protein
MSVEVLRQIVSISVEKNWRLGRCQGSFPASNGIQQRNLRTAASRRARRLACLAAGKPSIWTSGKRSFMISHIIPGSHCPYSEAMPIRKTVFASDDCSLIVTVQVDNLIYTGTAASMDNFEEFMKTRFQHSFQQN